MNEEDIKILEEIKQSIDTEYGSGRRKVQAIDNMINLIQKQQEELEQKDKIIDEMAKVIFIEMNDYANPEEVKQYFEKKVEDKQC